MNHAQATQFKHRAAVLRCPSCGDKLLRARRLLFCRREHGTRVPPWAMEGNLPEATRTASPGRFTIDGMDGFWRNPSHMDLNRKHDGPPPGSVVATIKRFNSPVPTAVVLVCGKKPVHAATRKRGKCMAAGGRPPSLPKSTMDVLKRLHNDCSRNEPAKRRAAIACVKRGRKQNVGRPYGAFIKDMQKKMSSPVRPRPEPRRHWCCLTAMCGRKTVARGLCHSCHKSASILIAGRKTTWGELEDYGLANPPLT
jgi:hypothetical protein